MIKLLVFLRKQLDRLLYRSRITEKLLISSLLFMFIPLVLFTAYFCIRSTQNSRTEILASIQSTFEQSYISISNKLNYIQSSSYYFMVNSRLDVLNSATPQKLPLKDQLDVKNALSLQFPSKNFGSDIADTYIFLNTSFPILEASDKIYSFDTVKENLWLQYALSETSYTGFIPTSMYVRDATDVPGSLAPSDRLSFIRKIPAPDNYQKASIIVRFDFRKSELDVITENTNCTPASRSFLSDSSGDLIAGFLDTASEIALDFRKTGPFETIWTQVNASGQTYRIGQRQVADTDWYLVSIVPEKDIMTHSTTMEHQFILLAVLLLGCTLVYISCISVSITGRIRTLARNMHCYDSSQLNLMPPSKFKDEIGMLIDEYNYLITHIQNLLEFQEENQRALHASQIRILRAQMNPHFLYNTLEMLRWYANQSDKTMVDEIIRQLSTFYKLSLNRGQEYYHVSDEVGLLQAYFNIMNLRYQNRIHFKVSVDEKVQNCLLPIILLQPIVENAINHGILLKPDKSGTIQLTASLESCGLVFRIQDDGVGMDISVMNEINQGTFQYTASEVHSGNSIGIKNIAGRIRLLYGDDYGITYALAADGGTIATVIIPAQFK